MDRPETSDILLKMSMGKNLHPIVIDGIQTTGKCRENSFYIRFNDEDIEELARYAFDMGYVLKPESPSSDPRHPLRFKITCKNNPSVYGWISKVIELKDGGWQDSFLYGFYRHGKFRVKYPVTFNVNSNQMRGIMKRNAEMNPRLATYFKTIFGILDLEPQINLLDFIFSWLSSYKIKRI